MAFEPNYEKVATTTRLKLGSTQAVIECKLPANENYEISKILCANAKSYISNVEVGEREVDFNGFVNFLVVYESQDGMSQSLDYSAEFKEKFKNDKIKIGDEASVTAFVVDVNTTQSNSTNEVKVVAVVEINVDVVSTTTTDVLVGVMGENVFVQTEEMSVTSLVSDINEKFEIMQDIEIRDSISQVLSVCTNAFLESATPNSGFATLRGGVNVNVLYLTNTEQQEIRSYQTLLDFSQEVANGLVTPESALQSVLALQYSDIKVTTTLQPDSAVVAVSLPLAYEGFVFAQNKFYAVTDIFSTQNQITTTTNSIVSLSNLQSAHYTEKINGNITVDDNSMFIDEVLGTCCNNVVLASSALSDGTLTIEGIAYTTVMYYNKEFNTTNSIEVELPFSLGLMANNVEQNSTPIVSIALGDVLTRARRGKEIEVNATLFINADYYGESVEAVITSLEVGEEKPESECVLSVYIAKPYDTLWDIAKHLNVSPDAILEQNPELELPIKGGERIIIYRQQEIMF